MSDKVKVQVWFNKNFPASMLTKDYDLDDFEFGAELSLLKNEMYDERDYFEYVFELMNRYDQMFTSRSLSVGDLIAIDLKRYLITDFGFKEI